MPRLRGLTAIAATVVLAAVGCGTGSDTGVGAAPSSAAAAPPPRPALPDVERLARYVVGAEADRSGPTDPQYFADGVWHNADGRCWYCALGPGVTSAALWRFGENDRSRARFRRLAVQTFDAVLAQHQAPDGSFGPPLQGQEGPGIATMFTGSDLATALIVLRPTLDAPTTRRWRTALERATRYVAHEFGDYYVNGNINLGVSLLAAMTAKVSPTAEFRALATATRRFALFPQTPQAAGFGLRVTRTPTRPDGADGQATLVEKGGGGPGYDPEYTSLQADLLARAVVLLDRPADVRLLNMLGNQLLPSIDPGTMLLDTSSGTRHTEDGRQVPYLSPVPTVLALRAGRHEFGTLARQQFPRVRSELLGALDYSYDNMYRAVGTALGTALMARPPHDDDAR